MRRSASSMRRITGSALVWKYVPTQRPSMRLPDESQSMILSLKGAFVFGRRFSLRFIRCGSDRAGGEAVPSTPSVDRHSRARVNVPMHVAAGDAGAGIDVPAHSTSCDAFPRVHVAGNHAAMNVACDFEILQDPLDDVNLNPALHAILLPHIVDQDFAVFGDPHTVAAERAAIDGDLRHAQEVARTEWAICGPR